MQAFRICNEPINLITTVKNRAPKLSQGKDPDIMFYRCTHAHTHIKQWAEDYRKVIHKTSPLSCVFLSLSSCLFPEDVIHFGKSSQTPQYVICYHFICCFKPWTLGRKREMLLIVSTVSGEPSMWKVVWTVWFSFLKLPIRTSLCKQLRRAVWISGKLKLRCLRRLFHSCREWANWFSLVYTDDPSVCLKPLWSACISTLWVNR